MKRVIQFSRVRYLFFGFSAVLLLIGIVAFIVNRGLNLGVDFKAGIAFQLQVAPASFSVTYTGADKVRISLPAGEQALTSPGDIIFTVTNAQTGAQEAFAFRYQAFATVSALAEAIRTQVAGIAVELKGDASASPTELIPLPRPADITGAAVTINRVPGPGRGAESSIAEMRALLSTLSDFSLQAVGAPANQEFMVRIPVKTGADESTFQEESQKALLQIIEGKYGAGQVILKSTEFVGARMAQSLATQTIWLVLIALVLILAYMMFRFHPWIYAVAAVLGIMHDALMMLSFDAVFRVEVDAGTIAAILTILGYSINDTIVNFDRARENSSLMRGSSLRTIIDTSVTQTLSRTFITSGATLLTVIGLFILTTGTIRNFALNMIVGIVEGTYSTFISAFIVIEWVTWTEKRRKAGELKKYGIAAPQRHAELPVAPQAAEVEQPADAEAEGTDAQEEVAPGALDSAALGSAALAAEPAAAAGTLAPAAQPASAGPAIPVAFLGQQGSRKHKKRRRRHH
jgi:preprotein translocase subunit SecF